MQAESSKFASLLFDHEFQIVIPPGKCISRTDRNAIRRYFASIRLLFITSKGVDKLERLRERFVKSCVIKYYLKGFLGDSFYDIINSSQSKYVSNLRTTVIFAWYVPSITIVLKLDTYLGTYVHKYCNNYCNNISESWLINPLYWLSNYILILKNRIHLIALKYNDSLDREQNTILGLVKGQGIIFL